MKKEKYLEKTFRVYEERYCTKHGRKMFVKHIPRLFVGYAIATALAFILGVTILTFGIVSISFWYFSREALIIAGTMLILAIIIMTLFILPPYWKLAKKCKAEQEKLINAGANKN